MPNSLLCPLRLTRLCGGRAAKAGCVRPNVSNWHTSLHRQALAAREAKIPPPPPFCVGNKQNNTSNPSVSPSGAFAGGGSAQTHPHRPTPQQPTQQRTARPQPSAAAYPYQPQPYQAPQHTGGPARIFVPSAEYFKCRQKRKAAIIGLCTLGLAGITLVGVGNTWRSNIFESTSFATGGIGFVCKCLSFVLLAALVAIPYFVYSFFALIYYTVRMRNLKAR